MKNFIDDSIELGLIFLEKIVKTQKELIHYTEHDWTEGTYPLISNYEFEGHIYDLGFYTDGKYVSAHIVFGNNPGDYMSGDSFWASSPLYRKVAGILLKVDILKKQELINQFARNSNWENFYKIN